MKLGKRAFRSAARHRHVSFDHDLCSRGDIKVVRLALDHFDRFATQRTKKGTFVDLRRDGHAADDRRSGVPSLNNCEWHRLADFLPFLPNHANVLLGQD